MTCARGVGLVGWKSYNAGSKVKDPTRKTDVWGTHRTSSGKSRSQNPHPFRKNREKDGPPARRLSIPVSSAM
jgi:hypothetical protein